MKGLKLYLKYIRMNFLMGLQYKGWPIMVLQVMIVVITDPIGTVFLFSRFGSIGEWSVERIILIYAMAVTSFGLAETFCRGFDYFPWRMIRSGDFEAVWGAALQKHGKLKIVEFSILKRHNFALAY